MTHPNKTQNKKQAGFTLVELSIVLILFGFAASTVLLALNTYTETQRVKKTIDATQISRDAINAFAKANGRYPCPARLTAAEGNQDYGHDASHGATPETARLDATADAAAITLILDNMPGDSGQVDLDADGNEETFIVGAVPYKTLTNALDIPGVLSIDVAYKDIEFGAQHTSDGWGNKIVYAISRHLCDPTPANALNDDPRGVIDVVINEECVTGGNSFPVSLLPGEGACKQDNKRFAQFITLSHGENQRGAFNVNSGNRVEQCITGVVLPPGDPLFGPSPSFVNGNASDRENCDYDGLPGVDDSNEGRFYAGLYTENDNEYFDDTIKFFFEDSSVMWETGNGIFNDNGTPGDPSDDFLVSQIRNTNQGLIGVGVNDPQEQLHVEGDLQAFDIHAEGYCDENSPGGSCLGAEVLAGRAGVDNNMGCPTGQIMKRIQNNAAECEDPFVGANFTCGTNGSGVQLYLQTVFSDGRATCCDLTDPGNPVCTTN